MTHHDGRRGIGLLLLNVRYANVAHVWVLNGLSGSIEIPETIGGLRRNHYTLDRVAAVPDGGGTLGPVGMAMLCLGYLRRRMA